MSAAARSIWKFHKETLRHLRYLPPFPTQIHVCVRTQKAAIRQPAQRPAHIRSLHCLSHFHLDIYNHKKSRRLMSMCFHSVQAAAHAFPLLVQMAVRVASIVEFQLYNRSARKIENGSGCLPHPLGTIS